MQKRSVSDGHAPLFCVLKCVARLRVKLKGYHPLRAIAFQLHPQPCNAL